MIKEFISGEWLNTEHTHFKARLVTDYLDQPTDYFLTIEDSEYSELTEEQLNLFIDINLENLKQAKIEKLSKIAHTFDNQLVNNNMVIISSLGYKIDADLRSQNNIRSLIETNETVSAFKLADDTYVTVTTEELTTMLSECIKNGTNLYAQKWGKMVQIQQATSIEELESISLDFTMSDFLTTQ